MKWCRGGSSFYIALANSGGWDTERRLSHFVISADEEVGEKTMAGTGWVKENCDDSMCGFTAGGSPKHILNVEKYLNLFNYV